MEGNGLIKPFIQLWRNALYNILVNLEYDVICDVGSQSIVAIKLNMNDIDAVFSDVVSREVLKSIYTTQENCRAL